MAMPIKTVAWLLAMACCGLQAAAPVQATEAVPALSAELVAEVAQDTARMLPGRFPPGPTRWILKRPSNDLFAQTLVDRLRRSGYAVQELAGRRRDATPRGVALDFLFERVEDGLFKVVVQADGQRFSRAYYINEGQVLPGGAWARGSNHE